LLREGPFKMSGILFVWPGPLFYWITERYFLKTLLISNYLMAFHETGLKFVSFIFFDGRREGILESNHDRGLFGT
jgi:hypothetical protein